MELKDSSLSAKFLPGDRDSRFTAALDEVFRSEGMKVVCLRYSSPRANSIAERFVGTAHRGCLDHLLIFGRRHLERALAAFIERSHDAWPDQRLEQRLPYAGRAPAGVGRRTTARGSARRRAPPSPLGRLTR